MKMYRCSDCGEGLAPGEFRQSNSDDVEGIHTEDEGGCGGVVEKVPSSEWPEAGAAAALQRCPDSTMFMRRALGDAQADDGTEIEISSNVGGGIVLIVRHPEVETEGPLDGITYVVGLEELARAAHSAFKSEVGELNQGEEDRDAR